MVSWWVSFFLSLLLFVFLFVKKKSRVNGSWPFYAKRVLSDPEQVLYHRLVSALPDCIVLSQVQLSRVLGVKKGFDEWSWNNRINRMSLDFVVCLKDFTVVAAVELDDRSHDNFVRKKADLKKDQALAAAGVPIIRWRVTALPDEATISRTFLG